MNTSIEVKLPTGTLVSVNDKRVRYDLPTTADAPPKYNVVSSAILNGGHQTFASPLHVLNYRVPGDYNGYDPSPHELLRTFAREEGLSSANGEGDDIVGLLTAASMKTFSTASRSCQGIHVDVVVTAGLSNSRSAGAEADYFVLTDASGDNDDKDGIKPGTINTVVITNAALTPDALIEAYAIAIEAKCAACVSHGVCCAKDPTAIAQGTGTDCCVLISPSNDRGDGKKEKKKSNVVKHSGKHTLFAEMVGQAVNEATSEAIMINVRHMHGSYAQFAVKRWLKSVAATLKGARPCIPPRPMMPVPKAPPSIVAMGTASVTLSFLLPLPDKAGLLLGAVAWDRYLGEPPLKVHPVVLAGSAISGMVSLVPDKVYNSPLFGFCTGLLLLVSMLMLFIPMAWFFLQCVENLFEHGTQWTIDLFPAANRVIVEGIFKFGAWVLQLLLFKSTFSIQLLCTLALQMAKFLERNQLDDARAQLSWLCSRDPTKLNSGELAGGTLESLAENLSDGFVAPLLWYCLLGPLGALGYRVANTLDSRVGYRGKYEWFGKPSARFDDIINLAPARITTIILCMAAFFVPGCSPSNGIAVALRDRSQCESSNAGWPMACMAGILSVRLVKPGEYCLGSGPVPGPADIKKGQQVAQIAGGLTLLLAVSACSLFS